MFKKKSRTKMIAASCLCLVISLTMLILNVSLLKPMSADESQQINGGCLSDFDLKIDFAKWHDSATLTWNPVPGFDAVLSGDTATSDCDLSLHWSTTGLFSNAGFTWTFDDPEDVCFTLEHVWKDTFVSASGTLTDSDISSSIDLDAGLRYKLEDFFGVHSLSATFEIKFKDLIDAGNITSDPWDDTTLFLGFEYKF